MTQMERNEQFLEFPETRIAAELVYTLFLTASCSIQRRLPHCALECTLFSLTSNITNQRCRKKNLDRVKLQRFAAVSTQNCSRWCSWRKREAFFLWVYLQRDDIFFSNETTSAHSRISNMSESCYLDLSSRCAVLLLLKEQTDKKFTFHSFFKFRNLTIALAIIENMNLLKFNQNDRWVKLISSHFGSTPPHCPYFQWAELFALPPHQIATSHLVSFTVVCTSIV